MSRARYVERQRHRGFANSKAADRKCDPRGMASSARERNEEANSGVSPRLEVQRRSLLALQAQLLGNVTRAADTVLSCGQDSASASPDVADRATDSLEQDLALSLLGSAEGTLGQIEDALRRIDDGSYGLCADCHATIPVARLEAIPYATCCVECARRQERAA